MPANIPCLPGIAVPKHLVHKRAPGEVFLTGWRTRPDAAVVITAQWPRTHSFYRPVHGRYDSLLFAETLRQTLPLLSHQVFGVPLGHQLIWGDLSFSVSTEAMQLADQPQDVTLSLTFGDVVRRRDSLTVGCVSMTAVAHGTTIGHARTRFSAHSPGVYQRLRAGRADLATARANALHPGPGLLPASVGRHLAQDVVLSPTQSPTQHARTWRLRADLDHPILFDHPVDHAPGMLLLEAARQATVCGHPAGNAAVTDMTTRFHRYVELDRPAWVRLAPGDNNVFHVRVDQDERTCFEAEVAAAAPLPSALPDDRERLPAVPC
ncbi:ScbA/BarX family gamma-butyrolactone biosynthesis protein [Streptacidiphilus fuscans]|uniref:Transcriptional regulator n=1 Tax=Streptacidiphilus fuscans TaxID=2789292 RepID=A0A931BG19_9ACTN|nr:ScbA/BarX family gamma-butyrolactone biosynthesis protein [Streptacidiphilus fuscans]MBF9072795.1 transcriptional regulator [Streptacidiphilus fuscans]